MNPYSPSETNTGEEERNSENPTPVWPLLLLNLAFLMCAVLVVVLPGLGRWMLVSVLIVFSIGGWALARSLRQQ